MEAIINKIQDTIENEYSNENFTSLVKEIFPGMQLVAPDKLNEEYSNFSSYVDGYTHIGNYITPDNKKILILSIQLKNAQYVENSRSAQRNFAKKLIENNHCDASFIAFYTKPIIKRDETEIISDKDNKWRISFVKIDYSVNFDNGKMKTNKNLTPAKRYSYLVGKGEPSHTTIERIKELINKKNELTINDIENAFSVEKVTDEFFKAYTEKYNDLNDYLKENDDFKHEAQRLGLKTEEFSVQFSKKLLGQIVFLYFLQKKGWLGVNAWPSSITEKEFKHAYYDFDKVLTRNYIPKLYIKDQSNQDLYRLNTQEFKNISSEDESYLARTVKGSAWGTGPKDFMRKFFDYAIKKDENKNFYDDYLEPLFYDALNNNRGEEGYWPDFHCRIPFLSGSLFEPINNYDWQHSEFKIPNDMFSNKKSNNDLNGTGILDIFDRYNFTMSEDEPMEKEVAIDPEMLGKVFENMLEIKDRQSKGAFYTPREIVHYMCQESLINYLINNTGISHEAIRDFILYGEYIKSEDTNKNNNTNLLISKELYQENANGEVVHNRLLEIDNLLANIKVADPAVGSGAFPLGMLNEIVKARTTITDYLYKYENAYSKKIIYTNDRSVHKLKVDTIKNSIFAVDLEPSAVDIAQLRLWLSLVIDDDINPNAQTELEGHKNPLPLPNLECNILCGNSLIDEIKGCQLIESSSIIGLDKDVSFSTSTFNILLEKLLTAEDKLFSCSNTEEKLLLKKEIADIKFEIIKMQIISNGNGSNEVLEEINMTKNLNAKPYVVWQLDFAKVFRDKKGFDIVIGNPPYLKEREYKEVFDKISCTEFGKKYGEGKMNYWYYFFHKGMDLLNNNGTLSFIASNYFIAGSGAKKLNNRIINETTLKLYIDFNKTKVFETADVQCMILLVENKKHTENDEVNVYKLKNNIKRNEIDSIMGKLKEDNRVNYFVVKDQHDILTNDNKLNFENSKFRTILQKIEIKTNKEKLFKATQGIVENPNCLNDRNIKTVKELGVDTSEFKPGDEVFVISKSILDELNLNSNEKGYIREYHSPSDVNRYVCNYECSNYLLYLTRDNINDIDLLPNIKKHLEKYKIFMELRRETKNGSNKWFHLHWPRKEEIFRENKIIYPQMGRIPMFAYSDKPFYVNMSANIIYPKKNIDLKVLTAILNSELSHFWLLNRAKNRGIGLDIAVSIIDIFPVNELLLNDEKLKVLAHSVIDMANAGKDYTSIDNDINNRVYELYNISLVEQATIKAYIQERIEK